MKKKENIIRRHIKSSAALVSLIIHLVIIIIAFSFVAVTVINKKESQFVNPSKPRPKALLKKLQLPNVNKKEKPKPKLRKLILAKPKVKTVTDNIKLPDTLGVRGGIGSGAGEGLGTLGFSLELPDFFGSNRRGTGNEFIGQLYDLKQTDDGDHTEIGKLVNKGKSNDHEDPFVGQAIGYYRDVLRQFLGGWNDNILKRYYMAPREKYAQAFMIPAINATEAPKAFGVEQSVNPSFLVALYKGEISAPETGKYRFCGRGDDVLVVRLKKRVVLDASLHPQSGWQSNDPNNFIYDMYYDMGVVLGDWISLKKGDVVPMEVLIGEEPGGGFLCQLYIEQEGKEYATSMEDNLVKRPIYPIFKTTNLPNQVIHKMEINSNWATPNGPNFGVIK